MLNENQNQGKLIVLEGVDAAGKSTLARALTMSMKDLQLPVEQLSFPSHSGEVGRLIRKAFVGDAKINKYAMQYLFTADQIDWEEFISDQLSKGHYVILDRHAAISAFAYGAETHSLSELQDIVQPEQFLTPDLVVVVDVPPDIALERRLNRTKLGGEENKIYENDDLAYLTRLRQRYMAYVLTNNNAMAVDGTKHISDLVKELLETIFSERL